MKIRYMVQEHQNKMGKLYQKSHGRGVNTWLLELRIAIDKKKFPQNSANVEE